MTTEPKRYIHVIGAGMAGLSAALQLTLMGEKVFVYESTSHAGGRARSYYDRELDCGIDNGNHLVLSGNMAVRDYLTLTHADETVNVAKNADFPFMDVLDGKRWEAKLNLGRTPWWILNKERRIPGTKMSDYFSASKILSAQKGDIVGNILEKDTEIYRKFWAPLCIAALNTEPEIASAQLLANIFRQSFGAGGKACLPIIPKLGLSETFVDPCLATLQNAGTGLYFNHRLRKININAENYLDELDFGTAKIALYPEDWVVMATPPWVAQELMPALTTPNLFRSIFNIHFRVEVPKNMAGFTGLINGTAEWVFVRGGITSVTISAADRIQMNDGVLVDTVWRDLAKLFDLDGGKIPPYRIVKEKRATFAATPEQELLRPTSVTPWRNMALAGDYTATGLPSTIEGAIRSGIKAAQTVIRWGA